MMAALSKLQNKLTKKATLLKETKKKKDDKPKEEKSKKRDYSD